jgi:hypothetical protein
MRAQIGYPRGYGAGRSVVGASHGKAMLGHSGQRVPRRTGRYSICRYLCGRPRRAAAEPATRWEPNDLIGMLYLAWGAAYADGVAAEHTATRYLNAAWRAHSEPFPVVPTLRELVSSLPDLELD